MDIVEGLKALICGMTTVFAVLILISFIIDLFKFIKPVGDKKNTQQPIANNSVIIPNEQVASIQEQDDFELVAVLTAAIAATLGTSSDKLVVTSYKKLSANRKWLSR